MDLFDGGEQLLSFDPTYYGGYPNSYLGTWKGRGYLTEWGLNMEQRLARSAWVKDLQAFRETRLAEWIEKTFDLERLTDRFLALTGKHGVFASRFFRYSTRARLLEARQVVDEDRKVYLVGDIDREYEPRKKNGRALTIGTFVWAKDLEKVIIAREEKVVDQIAGNWCASHAGTHKCAICDREFSPLNFRQWVYHGADGLTRCCMRCQIIDCPTERELQKIIPEFVEVCGFIPKASAGPVERSFTKRLNVEAQLEAYRLYGRMGGLERVKDIFGSWFKGMSVTGAIPEDVQETSRGIRCIANDGHECDSLSEKEIDDWLHEQGIEHEREPCYPEDPVFNPTGRRRADWKLKDGRFVEFFGLKGKKAYDEKTSEKRWLAEKKRIPLIEIYPEDLNDLEKCFYDHPA